MPLSSPRKRAPWRRFWRHSFWARVFYLGLSSGIGGFFVGELIGLSNWISSGPFHPWWYWAGFTAPVNGLWMMLFGFGVGLIIFSAGALASSRWSASHKRRFARGIKTRVFLPVVASIIATSTVVACLWIIRHGGFSSTTSDLGNSLGDVEIATLSFVSCLFSVLLAFSTKHPRRKKRVRVERLLPLD